MRLDDLEEDSKVIEKTVYSNSHEIKELKIRQEITNETVRKLQKENAEISHRLAQLENKQLLNSWVSVSPDQKEQGIKFIFGLILIGVIINHRKLILFTDF